FPNKNALQYYAYCCNIYFKTECLYNIFNNILSHNIVEKYIGDNKKPIKSYIPFLSNTPFTFYFTNRIYLDNINNTKMDKYNRYIDEYNKRIKFYPIKY